MQVDLLRRMLPIGARVGTVDKFQGQEAAVVLISMATSSAEDMPHNIEFLYSRNRLNVAISRARCLAVIFANPRLLGHPAQILNKCVWSMHGAGQRHTRGHKIPAAARSTVLVHVGSTCRNQARGEFFAPRYLTEVSRKGRHGARGLFQMGVGVPD